MLQQLRAAPWVPTPEDTWKDIKCHEGTRGELQTIFRMAQHISRGIATAASLEQTEEEERRERGGRHVDSD